MPEHIKDGPEQDVRHIADVLWREIKQGPGWPEDSAKQLRYPNVRALEEYLERHAEPGAESVVYRFLRKVYGPSMSPEMFAAAFEGKEYTTPLKLPIPLPPDNFDPTVLRHQRRAPQDTVRHFRLSELVGEREDEQLFNDAVRVLSSHIELTQEEIATIREKVRTYRPTVVRTSAGVEQRYGKDILTLLEKIGQLYNEEAGGWPTFSEVAREIGWQSDQVNIFLKHHVPDRLWRTIIRRHKGPLASRKK